jgi:hypothetical protein
VFSIPDNVYTSYLIHGNPWYLYCLLSVFDNQIKHTIVLVLVQNSAIVFRIWPVSVLGVTMLAHAQRPWLLTLPCSSFILNHQKIYTKTKTMVCFIWLSKTLSKQYSLKWAHSSKNYNHITLLFIYKCYKMTFDDVSGHSYTLPAKWFHTHVYITIRIVT